LAAVSNERLELTEFPASALSGIARRLHDDTIPIKWTHFPSLKTRIYYMKRCNWIPKLTSISMLLGDVGLCADNFPSDANGLAGDHLKLRVNVDGFEPINNAKKSDDANPSDNKKCAPKGSKLTVTNESNGELSVRFKLPKWAKEPGMFATEEAPTKEALTECRENLVNDYTQYKISSATLSQYSFRRTGIMFGALVVPFKFYVSGDKKISSSSTIAPYIGFRGPAPFGLTFTPVVSAGLGLVPVSNPDDGQTDTKSAFSIAAGVRLSSSKNELFNAGVLFGKDFLSKSDQAADRTIDKVWISLYVGYKL
jgi:hypothetical protein